VGKMEEEYVEQDDLAEESWDVLNEIDMLGYEEEMSRLKLKQFSDVTEAFACVSHVSKKYGYGSFHLTTNKTQKKKGEMWYRSGAMQEYEELDLCIV
jgi:hypothetical protein